MLMIWCRNGHITFESHVNNKSPLVTMVRVCVRRFGSYLISRHYFFEKLVINSLFFARLCEVLLPLCIYCIERYEKRAVSFFAIVSKAATST